MKIRAIAALLFILISVSAFGEGRIKITGYVRDADGNPLELVNVRVKNVWCSCLHILYRILSILRITLC